MLSRRKPAPLQTAISKVIHGLDHPIQLPCGRRVRRMSNPRIQNRTSITTYGTVSKGIRPIHEEQRGGSGDVGNNFLISPKSRPLAGLAETKHRRKDSPVSMRQPFTRTGPPTTGRNPQDLRHIVVCNCTPSYYDYNGRPQNLSRLLLSQPIQLRGRALRRG